MFKAACAFERWLLQRGVHLPFGMRGLTVVRRPLDGDSTQAPVTAALSAASSVSVCVR